MGKEKEETIFSTNENLYLHVGYVPIYISRGIRYFL
jgi:hypothetical protein